MKKIIVISGGSKGLGKAIAQLLNNEYQVIILARQANELKKTAKQIGCDFKVCDISNPKETSLAIKSIIKKFHRIDCLINCAAVWVAGELKTNTEKEVSQAIDINIKGTLLLTRAIIPQMMKQKSGLVININSQDGLYAKAERSLYIASKWAMTGFTKSLQLELAPYGIGVTGIYPGRLEISMSTKGGKSRVPKGVPLDNIAKTVQFILSFKDKTIFPEIGIKHLNN